MGIEYDNARDGALSGFCYCGSMNKIGGSGTSDLHALGVGWEERLSHAPICKTFYVLRNIMLYFIIKFVINDQVGSRIIECKFLNILLINK